MTLLLFSPQAANERGPKYLEAFIASLVAMPLRTRWSLGIGTREGRAVLLLRVPDSQQRRIAAALSNAYCRLLIDGMPSRPFSMTTIPPAVMTTRRSEIVRRVSRQHYSRTIKDARDMVSSQVFA